MALGEHKLDVERREIKSLEDLEVPFLLSEYSISGDLGMPFLLSEYSISDSKNNDGTANEEETTGSIGMVLLSIFVAVCGSIEMGCCVGYSSPTQSAIMKDLNLSTSQYSVFGSILPIGAMFGAFTSGRIADHIGRKGAMRMSAGFCIAGWLAVFFSEQYFSLDMGRFVTGYGIGVFSFVVPVFIAEISPKNLRGGLTALNQLLNITGASTAFLLGSVISWRALALTGLVPCIFLLIGMFFVPESPRWLAKVGRDKEFKVALQKLRGKDADITREADEIKDSVEILEALPKTRVLDLFQRQYIWAVFIAGGIMMLQQFSGINGIAYYTRETFVAAGLSSATVGTTAYACVEVPATMVGALLMDKSGRKPLIMFSAAGTFLGCSITGISFLLKSHGLLLEWVPILAVAGLLIFISAYAIGMGPVPWGIMSEIFPINIKGVGGSLVVLVNWVGAWIVAYTFNFLISWSFSGTFFLYSGFSLMTLLFVAKFVPETKGKTLEEIQEYIHKNGERISSGKLEILV